MAKSKKKDEAATEEPNVDINRDQLQEVFNLLNAGNTTLLNIVYAMRADIARLDAELELLKDKEND